MPFYGEKTGEICWVSNKNNFIFGTYKASYKCSNLTSVIQGHIKSYGETAEPICKAEEDMRKLAVNSTLSLESRLQYIHFVAHFIIDYIQSRVDKSILIYSWYSIYNVMYHQNIMSNKNIQYLYV